MRPNNFTNVSTAKTKTNNRNNRNNRNKQSKKKPTGLSFYNDIKDFIFKKGDVCCKEDVSKKQAILFLIRHYKKESPGSYLYNISNDIPTLIGYKEQLDKNKNTVGSNVWSKFDNSLYDKNEEPTLDLVLNVLNGLPLYYILALIGKALVKEQKKN